MMSTPLLNRDLFSNVPTMYSCAKRKYGIVALDNYFREKDVIKDGIHEWYSLNTTIDLVNEDTFIEATVEKVQQATGFDELLRSDNKDIQELFSDEKLKAECLACIMPSDDDNRPKPFKVSRSELGELVSQFALEQCSPIMFPFATHSLEQNPDAPKLGLDGFGLWDKSGELGLIIVETKVSEENKRPPKVAEELLNDCKKVHSVKGRRKILRTLLSFMKAEQHSPKKIKILKHWIEHITNTDFWASKVCPVIIRGDIRASHDDLKLFKQSDKGYSPNGVIGVSASVGVEIEKLCNLVMKKVLES